MPSIFALTERAGDTGSTRAAIQARSLSGSSAFILSNEPMMKAWRQVRLQYLHFVLLLFLSG